MEELSGLAQSYCTTNSGRAVSSQKGKWEWRMLWGKPHQLLGLHSSGGKVTFKGITNQPSNVHSAVQKELLRCATSAPSKTCMSPTYTKRHAT